MLRFGRVLLLALLALWLPATLHCRLEAAGFFDSHCEGEQTAAAAGDDCADDVCPTIEQGLYKDSSATFKVAAPAECHIPACCAHLLVPEPVIVASPLSPVRHAPPSELTVRWQFIARAAPPARAPSRNSDRA
jgi:hypothetical protein